MAPVVATALQFVARHWKWFAIGAAVIAIYIGFKIVEAERDEARRQFEVAEAHRQETLMKLNVSNASLDRLQQNVEEQNAAIDQLATEGQARIEAGQTAILAEVKRGARAQAVARELTQSPSADADQSRTSAKVMGNRELL